MQLIWLITKKIYYGTNLMHMDTLKKSVIAGFFSIFIIGTLTYLTYETEYGLFLVASFGSSMVLILGYPESPFAKGRNVFFGHIITSIAGLMCYSVLVSHLSISVTFTYNTWWPFFWFFIITVNKRLYCNYFAGLSNK